MAFLLIECPSDTPYESFHEINESLTRALPSDVHHILYCGTLGDFGLKISVILNDNESLASIYDNVREAKQNALDTLIPRPYDPELVVFPKEQFVKQPLVRWPFKRKKAD